jgi:hypothetical protein
MDWLRELTKRLSMLMHRRQFDADLEEEVRLHLELRQEEQFESGMTANEAREWFENLAQDVRYGARMLRKYPASRLSPSSPSLSASAQTPRYSV